MNFARIDPRRDAEIPATLHLGHPIDDEPLFDENGAAITIDLLGVDSDVGRRAAARMVKSLDRGGEKKQSLKSMSIDDILKAASTNENAKARFFAALTTGWQGITYIDDADMDNPKAKPFALDFTTENAVKLYSTRTWIMEKIDAFLGDKANFARRSSTD